MRIKKKKKVSRKLILTPDWDRKSILIEHETSPIRLVMPLKIAKSMRDKLDSLIFMMDWADV